MIEFKLDDFPACVKQLAEFSTNVLKMDTGLEWEVDFEIMHWDARIIVHQNNYKWQLSYYAGMKFTEFLVQLSFTYQAWKRLQK